MNVISNLFSVLHNNSSN